MLPPEYITINDGEVKLLTGENNLPRAVEKLQARGPKTIVVKRGEYGAVLFHGDQCFSAPALPVKVVKDPTGAGDTFAGGMMGYLDRQKTFDFVTLKTAVICGSVMSSFNVQEFSCERLKNLTTPEIMAWMADEFGKITGDTSGAVITGKPLDKGGSEGRGTATAQGGFYVFEALRGKLGLPAACRVVIQGFGNAGDHAAELWTRAGHAVIAVSDSKGAIFLENAGPSLSGGPVGLDIAAVTAHKKATGSVVGMEGTRTIANDELLSLDCDLLIPAALENQIRADNVGSIRAKAIMELANGPTTPEADDALFARGVAVVPDILFNAGGVTVSTFEWEQNLKGEHWSEEEVFDKLRKNMEEQGAQMFHLANELYTDLRRAAFVLALRRIAEVMIK